MIATELITLHKVSYFCLVLRFLFNIRLTRSMGH